MKSTDGKYLFDPKDWQGYHILRVSEKNGLRRDRTPVHASFRLSKYKPTDPQNDLRLALEKDGVLCEIPFQLNKLCYDDGELTGEAVFIVEHLEAKSSLDYRLYFGNPTPAKTSYQSDLTVRKGDLGPQHRWIENEFYKAETLPLSGQIWHMWNKLGSNTSWHHNEWDSNKDKGGDPCHWAPNCWAAYPERVTNGYEVVTGGEDHDLIDWNYAFGWRDPATEIVTGPVFCEIRRSGVVWPHPEHTNPNIRRDPSAFIEAQVVYRFYAGVPWFYQSSVLETLKDMRVFFIRNCQFVFLADAFTHTFLAPDNDGVKETDEVDIAVLKLMGESNLKPYPHQQHSFSNVLPSKLAYTGFINERNSDGFALFQLEERNRNINHGDPVYQNHATLFSELTGWSAYYCRAFSYTNQRYNPENATYLPKGERYEEENICFVFKHRDWPSTMDDMRYTDQVLKRPLEVAQTHKTEK